MFDDDSAWHGAQASTWATTPMARLLRPWQDKVRDKLHGLGDKLDDATHRRAWYHLARHFHVPTVQWAGPHSRSYATLLRPRTLAFIQRGTANRVRFLPEAEAYETLDGPRILLQCPTELYSYFTDLATPRVEIEASVFWTL